METTNRPSDISGGDPPAFKLLLSCPDGLSPSEVSVVFDRSYDRVPHPDISLENSISEIWESSVQKNPSLFNGPKFRYGGHTLRSRSDPPQKINVCLHLGLTDYRTFVGTNLNPLWERFLIPSEDDWRRCQHTSNPLGNAAVIETYDRKIVLIKRSANVGEFPGHFVFPGGHPEGKVLQNFQTIGEVCVMQPNLKPQEVGITSHVIEGELDHEMINGKVSQEMFNSIIREVVEEIGVPAATLGKPVFIGISQRVSNVRPAAFFFLKCSLESKEIQQLYSTAQDGYESTQLCALSMSELEGITSKMPGCHQGGLALYKLMVAAGKE